MFKFSRLANGIKQTLIISLITLVLSEITLRIYHKINPSFIFVDKTYNRWRGKPNAPDYNNFHLNSQGFKDTEFDVKKDKNTFRIVAVGDSFSFGVVPYEYNYLTLLEEQLKVFNSPHIQVYNMGITGMAPIDYYSMVVNEVLKYQPDLILLSFFIGNDFLENKQVYQKFGKKWYTSSYVASFLNFIINLGSKYDGKVHNPAQMQYQDHIPPFSDQVYLDIEKERSYIFETPPSKTFKKDFEDAFSYLIKIKQICQSRNIRFVVVLIPDEMQVNPSLQAKLLPYIQKGPQQMDFNLPNQLLSENFRKHRINYIDLSPYFAAGFQQQILYRPNDSHWNIAGNQLAANVLRERLQNKLSKPPK